MKKFAKLLIIVVVTYLISWTAMYFWLMKSDTSHFAEYLRLSWTGPGEIPTFIQGGAIGCTFLVLLIYVVSSYRARRGRDRKDMAEGKAKAVVVKGDKQCH